MGDVEDKSITIKFKIKDITKSWVGGGSYYRAKIYYEIDNRDIFMFRVSINASNMSILKSFVKQHIRKNLKQIKDLI